MFVRTIGIHFQICFSYVILETNLEVLAQKVKVKTENLE